MGSDFSLIIISLCPPNEARLCFSSGWWSRYYWMEKEKKIPETGAEWQGLPQKKTNRALKQTHLEKKEKERKKKLEKAGNGNVTCPCLCAGEENELSVAELSRIKFLKAIFRNPTSPWRGWVGFSSVASALLPSAANRDKGGKTVWVFPTFHQKWMEWAMEIYGRVCPSPARGKNYF